MRWIPVSAEPAQARAGGAQRRAVLELDSLQVRFGTREAEVVAVRDVTLAVQSGECLGVVGESGAGKTQSFLAALGLLAPNGRARGHARFEGQDLIGLAPQELDRIRGARIGMVFQDPLTSLTPHIAIGDQIAEPLVKHTGASWRQARAAALEMLDRVHVTDAERRMKQFPHQLSGGMRQRVLIAIALICKPTLLIADEPTTALDVTMQAQILALLAELKRSQGMAMVLVTHDLGAVAGVADRVAVMQGGQLVELDSVRAIMRAPQHPYTRALLRAVPRLDRENGQTSRENGQTSRENGRTVGDELLQVSALRVQYSVRSHWFAAPRPLRAVDDVTFELRAGEALGIVGESGSGKSTLARAALRLVESRSGAIAWLGRPVEGFTQRELRAVRPELQIIFQDPLASLDPRMRVEALVEENLREHRPQLDGAARHAAVCQALERVGLSAELLGRYPHELSGGQCQRVGIARALVLEPRVLVCDEPVSALDVTVQAQVLSLLAELKRQYGLALLFIGHNLAVVRSVCDRVLVLYLGRMMECADAHQVYTRALHPYTRELLECAPVLDPDVQPGRLARSMPGEAPSPLDPPSGCVYRTRCPHALERCAAEIPVWELTEHSSHRVACHRWRELAGA